METIGLLQPGSLCLPPGGELISSSTPAGVVRNNHLVKLFERKLIIPKVHTNPNWSVAVTETQTFNGWQWFNAGNNKPIHHVLRAFYFKGEAFWRRRTLQLRRPWRSTLAQTFAGRQQIKTTEMFILLHLLIVNTGGQKKNTTCWFYKIFKVKNVETKHTTQPSTEGTTATITHTNINILKRYTSVSCPLG